MSEVYRPIDTVIIERASRCTEKLRHLEQILTGRPNREELLKRIEYIRSQIREVPDSDLDKSGVPLDAERFYDDIDEQIEQLDKNTGPK